MAMAGKTSAARYAGIKQALRAYDVPGLRESIAAFDAKMRAEMGEDWGHFDIHDRVAVEIMRIFEDVIPAGEDVADEDIDDDEETP